MVCTITFMYETKPVYQTSSAGVSRCIWSFAVQWKKKKVVEIDRRSRTPFWTGSCTCTALNLVRRPPEPITVSRMLASADLLWDGAGVVYPKCYAAYTVARSEKKKKKKESKAQPCILISPRSARHSVAAQSSGESRRTLDIRAGDQDINGDSARLPLLFTVEIGAQL